MLYSRFSTNSDLRYSFAMFLFPIGGLILCIYKWVVIDYIAKRHRFFNKEDNFFSREFFNSWDFRTKRINDAKNNKKGIQNMFKVMVFEEVRKEIVNQRSGADRCRIYTIRACLMLLSIIILLFGW